MNNVLFLVLCGLVVSGSVGGYFLGRYQSGLLNKIRILSEQGRQEPPAEPEKPAVTGGAYQPPKEVSTTTNTVGAGLVETKTPERLSWENDNEISSLEHNN